MDSADTTPSNSKVIIQCTDPSNLFDSLEPRLSARSPLKNLHWKSPNRPLRSIANLNISLCREEISNGAQSAVRRHQIPGLRETPYVKLYLLRCDDKETYKETARKEVKQWIKANTSTSDSKTATKSQESHDAFEYLILHVVLPNTPAASQPRSSKHITLETAESTDSVNSKSKWSGKSSSTVFDKLRADFSSSSKTINRVAQVRLLEPNDKSTALSSAELEEQWQDLVESLKACILRSFDLRVAQYELDIRERDSQRNLPGWNFCTFFVLKEGLARGFESVGLLEDALAVYDELSLGLDTLLKEESEKNEHDDSGPLLRFSKESKSLLRDAMDLETESASRRGLEKPLYMADILSADRANFPFDVDRREYRNLILSNEVSALDLRIYLFTRQMEILLRQARAGLPKTHDSHKAGGDLNIIADVAERATQFISLARRSLRLELYIAWGGQEGLSEEELLSQRTVTGNIVSAWAWCAIMQILAQVTPLLGIDTNYWTESLSIDAVELSQNMEPGTPSDMEKRPRRLSLTSNLRSSSRERSLDRSNRHSMMTNGTNPQQILLSRPGSEKLLLWISKLATMAKHVLQNLETAKTWTQAMKQSISDALNVDETGLANGHREPESSSAEEATHYEESTAGLYSDTLRSATMSEKKFLELYVLLTVFSYRLLSHAKSHTALHQALIDLVEVEYAQKNYIIAARYLSNVLGPLPRSSYRPSDEYLLRMYADCLKHMDKPSEFTKCVIACLQCMAFGRFDRSSKTKLGSAQNYLDQLRDVSRTLTTTTVQLGALFEISRVATTITHLDGKDGFALSMALQTLSGPSTILLDEIKLRLASKDGSEPRFISLQSTKQIPISETATEMMLETSVMSQGWYNVDEVELRVGNLRLLHHFQAMQEVESLPSDDSKPLRYAVLPILVYPHDRSLCIRIRPSSVLHLAETRRLCIEVRPGHNNVKQCKLRLKTATAGLRLNIHDSRLVDEERPSSSLRTAREGDTFMMVIDDLPPESLTEIEIPYTMEVQSEPSITIRIDANYETDEGAFNLHEIATVNVLLPISVNVQDVYRPSCTYSRFSISPSTLVPLHLLDCYLEDNDYYSTDLAGSRKDSLVVFPRQPANWTVRLVPKTEEAWEASRKLTLVVVFQSLDDVILSALEEEFTTAFKKAGHTSTARLLTSHLRDQVRGAWTEQDLEVAGLTQEMEVWTEQDLAWANALCAIDRSVRVGIEQWLTSWHLKTSSVNLNRAKRCQRQLRLHVDIPPPPLIISANVRTKGQQVDGSTATLGQPLLAELELQLARPQAGDFEGIFELVAPTDSWLIGGRRKGSVQLTSEAVVIQTVFFPQQLGRLLLPTVIIKCRKRVTKGEKNYRDSWTEVTSDVYNTAHGLSILVTPDLRSTTVEVFGTVPDGGTGRLIGSKHHEWNEETEEE